MNNLIAYWLAELCHNPDGSPGNWQTMSRNLRMMGIETPGPDGCQTCPVAVFLSRMIGERIFVSGGAIPARDIANLMGYVALPYAVSAYIARNDIFQRVPSAPPWDHGPVKEYHGP